MRPDTIQLSKAVGLKRNPKDHDIGEINGSMNRFGYLERIVINEITGHLLAGHGRIETLRKMKVRGNAPPVNIDLSGTEWLVPCDYVEVPESEEEAVAIALNRLVEKGGWDENMLTQVLSDLAAVGTEMLDGIGFDADDIDNMLKSDKKGHEEEEGGYEAIEEQWSVMVECESEEQQMELINYLLEQGYNVRALIG